MAGGSFVEEDDASDDASDDAFFASAAVEKQKEATPGRQAGKPGRVGTEQREEIKGARAAHEFRARQGRALTRGWRHR